MLLLCFRPTVQSAYVIAGGRQIPVSIADTELSRQKGLSNTLSLREGTGKLFIFDTAGTYGFWMKDMRYPIDIVWIDADWTVVGVANGVAPESYPSVVYPPTSVQYVLELNKGEAVGDNLVIGSKVRFEK